MGSEKQKHKISTDLWHTRAPLSLKELGGLYPCGYLGRWRIASRENSPQIKGEISPIQRREHGDLEAKQKVLDSLNEF